MRCSGLVGSDPSLTRVTRAAAVRGCLLAWVFALVSARGVAAGQDVVRLSISDCETASAAEITKIVALELAPRITIVIDEAAPLEASLQCAEGRAVILVRDVDRAEPLELIMPLADTRREARPRLLALAIAELIATSLLEQTPRPKPHVEPVVVAPPPRERPLALGLAVGVVRAFEPALWPPALRIDAAHGFGGWSLHADVELDFGSRSTSAATLGARALSLGFAPALRLLEGLLDWDFGVGLRAGAVWLSATPRAQGLEGRSVSGIFIAPFVWTALELPLTAAWYLRLAIEVGYVVKPVRGLDADDVALLELRGVRGASLLGVGIRL
jgi:hypothetical protein